MEVHDGPEAAESENAPTPANLDTEKLASILGKEARYMFELPKGCPRDEFEAVFRDHFPRSQHFAGFLDEGVYALEFESEQRGCLRMGVFLSEPTGSSLDEARQNITKGELAEDLEEFVSEYQDVVGALRPGSEPLDDGECLAGCGFYRQESTGFCSKHAALAPKREEYAVQHSKKVRKNICEAIARYQAFVLEPLPAEFSEEFSGDGWDATVTFRNAGYR